jgi:hypothetical protein
MWEENLKRQRSQFKLLVWAVNIAVAGIFIVAGCAVKEKPLSQEEVQEEAKFYGGNTNFTATRVITIRWGASLEKKQTAMAFSEGNLREETAPSKDVPAMVLIRRPDKDTIYRYWTDKSNILIEQEFRSTLSREASSIPSIKEKSDVGQETMNGHPCIKCTATVQEGNRTVGWTIWEATDLNRFPIRIEFASGKSTKTVEFTNVTIGKPDPSLFEPPTDYKRLGRKFKSTDEVAAFMLGQVMKSMSGAGKGK